MKNLHLLTITEVMARTGLPRSTVYALVAHGTLAMVRDTPKGKMRVSEHSLEAWIERGSSPTVATPTRGTADAALPPIEKPAFA